MPRDALNGVSVLVKYMQAMDVSSPKAFFISIETLLRIHCCLFILTQGHTGDNERKKLWDELSRGIEHSRLVVVHLTKGNEGELGHVLKLSFLDY